MTTTNIYTEVTPNPASLKFMVADKILLPDGVADFPTPEDVGDRSPLATRLFKYPFVKGVMISQNFVTVTKADESEWEDLIPIIKEEVKHSLDKGEPIIDGADAVSANDEADNELEGKIRQLIHDQVRPAVAMDGGDIIYEGFDEGSGTVRLQLRGSCSGCPSSIVTLKAGIQSLLQRMVPEVKEVEAV